MSKSASQVLEDASIIIDRQRDLAKFTLEDDDRNYCAVGAVRVAAMGDLWGSFLDPLPMEVQSAVVAVQRDLGLTCPPDEFTLPHWNNAPERTKDEVRDQLMATAKRLRNEGR